jgi:hypothetical protein
MSLHSNIFGGEVCLVVSASERQKIQKEEEEAGAKLQKGK